MRHRTTILYALAWLAYFVFTFTMFPYLNSNVLIPVLALMAFGGWIFGRSASLLFLLITNIHHFSLTQYYAADYLYYADRLIGPLLCITIIELTGTLRNNLDSIKEANARLDQAVLERSGELTDLTRKLIERAETMRVSRGQELHDGIGQQLTATSTLYVENNGRPLTENPDEGMGLPLMHYRAAKIGASIVLGTTESGSTRCTCQVPHGN